MALGVVQRDKGPQRGAEGVVEVKVKASQGHVNSWFLADHLPWVPQTVGSGRKAWRWTPLTAHHLSISCQGVGSGRCVPCSPRTVTGR